MDAYSSEDAAGDLQLEVSEQRPAHELSMPGVWRVLAPLGVGLTFAAALAVSFFVAPVPATFEVPEPLREPWIELAAPTHVEPLLGRGTALAARPAAPAPAPIERAQPLAPAAPPTLAAVAPTRTLPHARPRPSVTPPQPAASEPMPVSAPIPAAVPSDPVPASSSDGLPDIGLAEAGGEEPSTTAASDPVEVSIPEEPLPAEPVEPTPGE